jgi:hypothetical protein
MTTHVVNAEMDGITAVLFTSEQGLKFQVFFSMGMLFMTFVTNSPETVGVHLAVVGNRPALIEFDSRPPRVQSRAMTFKTRPPMVANIKTPLYDIVLKWPC